MPVMSVVQTKALLIRPRSIATVLPFQSTATTSNRLSALKSATTMDVAHGRRTALEDARKLTRDNPAAVANIVKSWMNNEAPA